MKMPAGTYYIGDLCYVMHDVWDDFCMKEDGHNTFKNGIQTVHFSTYYGDGTYLDEQGRQYPVDAGLIGCIALKDIHDERAQVNLGQVVEFSQEFECSEDDGVLYFGNIVIDTTE